MWLLIALAAGYFAGRYAGAWGLLVFLLVFALLVVNPAAGAALVLLLVGFGLVCLLIYLLPQILAFSLGIVFVILLILGLGRLMGV
jgi:hypothetical protein